MSWFYLALAGAFECCWAIGLKYTDGFSKLWPSVFTVVTMGLSIFFLSLALKTIPLGTGYAIWTGVGAAMIAVAGMVLFAEPATLLRFACIGLIVVGIAGLKFTSGA